MGMESKITVDYRWFNDDDFNDDHFNDDFNDNLMILMMIFLI